MSFWVLIQVGHTSNMLAKTLKLIQAIWNMVNVLKMCQITTPNPFTLCTFSGGVRPFLIQNNDGNELWEQYSLGAESMRPYFILPGKENDEMMEAVCQKMDEEAKKTEKFTIQIEDTEITITVTWHLSLDGKLIDMSTGISK